MNYLTWIITVVIAVAPWAAINLYVMLKSKPRYSYLPYGYFLIIAALIYPMARTVPEPHIFDETLTFVQHFLGGGFISVLYYLYVKYQLKLRPNYIIEPLYIYAFVSSMGVANELLEFTATKLHIYTLDSSDVWYDLLANTLGACVAYAGYRIAIVLLRKK